MIEALCAQIPEQIRMKSGKVFYSGRTAFSSQSPLYILGLNPGGDPSTHQAETIESHTKAVLKDFPANWSAYRDESWRGFRPGSARLQKRVLHVLNGVGLDAGAVPSSNLVFVRSRRLDDIADEFDGLADQCWGFHAAAIENLKPKVILCFGRKAGKYVCRKVGARTLQAQTLEENERGWRNQLFVSSKGVSVLIATHPSIVDWTAVATDPTPLLRDGLCPPMRQGAIHN